MTARFTRRLYATSTASLELTPDDKTAEDALVGDADVASDTVVVADVEEDHEFHKDQADHGGRLCGTVKE